MKHIRFLESNETVCHDPEQMGSDFVVVDYNPDDTASCKECLQLLTNHNAREHEIDKAWGNIVRNYNKEWQKDQPEADPLAASRGCLFGVSLATVFWICAFLIWWVVTRG